MLEHLGNCNDSWCAYGSKTREHNYKAGQGLNFFIMPYPEQLRDEKMKKIWTISPKLAKW